MHVWYDSVNESLKYSVVNMKEKNITSNYAGKPGAGIKSGEKEYNAAVKDGTLKTYATAQEAFADL